MAGPRDTTTTVDWLSQDLAPRVTAGTQDQTAILPPVALIAVGMFTAVASVVLLPIPGLALHFAGWVLGSLATMGLLTAYSAMDAKRAQSSVYATLAWAGTARNVLFVVGMGAAALHSYFVATILAS